MLLEVVFSLSTNDMCRGANGQLFSYCFCLFLCRSHSLLTSIDKGSIHSMYQRHWIEYLSFTIHHHQSGMEWYKRWDINDEHGFFFKFLKQVHWLGSLALINNKWWLSLVGKGFLESYLVLVTSMNTLVKYGNF